MPLLKSEATVKVVDDVVAADESTGVTPEPFCADNRGVTKDNRKKKKHLIRVLSAS
ncbi:hypothetical protein KRR40_15560 [Niabella defluvii]|nr:hypothetical protein KRR40_15560 [Niabella sp. I65]